MTATRSQRWNNLVTRIESEYNALPAAEKRWIRTHLNEIAQCQRQLHELFLAGDGALHCSRCQGDCCAKGHNHMTLANLLSFLDGGRSLPPADFAATCPFLSATGCRLEVEERPYNCVTFICDKIEDSLTAAEKQSFYALDRRLRALYDRFGERYQGAAMTGLLLQEQRLAGLPFLQHRKSFATSTKG